MQYLCPKCGSFMQTVGLAVLPPVIWYECFSCGYKSKSNHESPAYMTLPKEMWSDEIIGDEDEFTECIR